MIKNHKLKMGHFIMLSVFLCVHYIDAQDNMDIYYKYCTAHPDTACFDPLPGATDTVGRDVGELGGGYRFCLKIDTVEAGFAPVRAVLVLDNSLSMCQNPGGVGGVGGAGGCCVVGDSSGNCMNNDPGDMRAEAAHMFVDSLRALNPQSEVGVIVFFIGASANGPLSLSSDQNVQQIHSWIDDAKCDSDWQQQDRRSGNATTNLGLGLDSALSLVDRNYDELSPSMARHIILLTDGAWDDLEQRPPDGLFNTYRTSYPDRTLPVVHGVFLSDSVTHVEHQYPPQGCAGNGLVDLSHLQSAAVTTGGLYFPGSRPETVIENFQTLLDSVAQPVPRTLQGMVVTNLTNGETRGHTTIELVPESVDEETHFQASIDNLPLVFGANTMVVQHIIQKPGGLLDTTRDTVTIFRTTEWTTKIIPEEWAVYCEEDNTTISITVTPDVALINTPFTVSSAITLKNKFILDTVVVRVFTKFPDTDPFTTAVYHLDNNLINSVNGTEATGAGTVEYTTTSPLFGSGAMTSGSFSASIGTLSDDFAFEAWINPSNTLTQTDIFTIGGNSFGIGADRKIYFKTAEGGITYSSVAVDGNSWSHIAVSRIQGTIILYINGANFSEITPFASALSGALTVTCPVGGFLDEIRISTSSRFRQDSQAPNFRLDIPSLSEATWYYGGVASAPQPYFILTPDMWNNGAIDFQFSSPIPGKLVVNFQHKGINETQWSKNGNPVFASADLEGPYILKGVYSLGPLGEEWDTLRIYFSEPIRCDSLKKSIDPATSFQIFGPDINGVVGQKTEVLVDAFYLDGDQCPQGQRITETTIIVKATVNGIVPTKDSILLVGSAVDTAGNLPDPTKKGPIVWGPGGGLIVVPQKTPKDQPMIVPKGIISRTNTNKTTGKAIIIQTQGPLVQGFTPTGEKTYGKTMIFDPVANVVAIDLPIEQFPNNERMYYIIWDGKNRYNRRVASGAYLLTGTVQYLNEPNIYRPLPRKKFSIKWENPK